MNEYQDAINAYEAAETPEAKDAACSRLAAMNDEVSDACVGGWQPIETAPRDGTPVLVLNGSERGFYVEPGQIGVACFTSDGFGEEDMWVARDCCDQVTSYKPTHWQPLPEPPSRA